MKTILKRSLCLALVLLFAMSALVACKKSTNTPAESQTEGSQISDVVESDSETETKLNERKEALKKSEEMLKKVIARRNKLIAAKERPVDSEAARALKAEEKAQIEMLKAKLREKGMSMEDIIKSL